MFEKITKATTKPSIWSDYTAELLWTDSHTTKQMLNFHLNPNLDLASRTAQFIDQSSSWLISKFQLNENSKVIDFGCGPGLYTQRLKAQNIGTVVGVDFSTHSLAYAFEQAKQANLAIEYQQANYLDYKDPRQFDLITLIMCDLCALSPEQRFQLFARFKSLLAAKGSIALDVYTSARFAKQKESIQLEKNAMNGFWSDKDYWCIQSSFLYQEEQVTLDKYVIIEKDREWVVYNWLQHFSLETLAQELNAHGLEIKESFSDLRGNPLVNGDEMALVIAHK